MDIELRPPVGPPIFLEFKHRARASEHQLLGYRRWAEEHDGQLALVTKRYPEVGERWLRTHRIGSIRWQEIHKKLGVGGRAPTGADRYLCNQFRQFLEESDMAYPSEIKAADVEQIPRLFSAISDVRNRVVDPQRAFDAASGLIQILDGVLRDALDEVPELQDRKKWRRRGPAYYNWRENKDSPTYHSLGFRLVRDPHGKQWIGAEVSFTSKNPRPRWVIQDEGGSLDGPYLLREICSSGVVDRGKMLRSFRKGLYLSGLVPRPAKRATRSTRRAAPTRRAGGR